MTDDLDVLDPAPRRVAFRGEVLELRPLRLGDLPAFSRAVRPVIAEFAGDRHPEWEDNDERMVLDMAELHGEAIIAAAAIATGRPAEWVAAADNTADVLGLVRAIVEVNHDFFIQAMMAVIRPAPAAAAAEPAATKAPDGPRPSSTSSAQATH